MVALDWNADSRLAASRRLIVKIGSALLVDELSGEIRTRWLTGLAADIAGLRDRGAEIVIVSSGAIAVGRTRLSLPGGDLALEQKQRRRRPARSVLRMLGRKRLALTT